MTPEQTKATVNKLVNEFKVLEACWVADMKARAPDGVNRCSFDLSLHSFMVGAFHAIHTMMQLSQLDCPNAARDEVVAMMAQEIKKRTGRDLYDVGAGPGIVPVDFKLVSDTLQ
jgi:hypothetical protein